MVASEPFTERHVLLLGAVNVVPSQTPYTKLGEPTTDRGGVAMQHCQYGNAGSVQ